MWKWYLIAAVIFGIAGYAALQRLHTLNAEKTSLQQQIDTLKQDKGAAEAARDATSKNYSDLLKTTQERLTQIAALSKAHSESIEALEQNQSKINSTMVSINRSLNEKDRAVLNARLPQYKCLFDGTCPASTSSSNSGAN